MRVSRGERDAGKVLMRGRSHVPAEVIGCHELLTMREADQCCYRVMQPGFVGVFEGCGFHLALLTGWCTWTPPHDSTRQAGVGVHSFEW